MDPAVQDQMNAAIQMLTQQVAALAQRVDVSELNTVSDQHFQELQEQVRRMERAAPGGSTRRRRNKQEIATDKPKKN